MYGRPRRTIGGGVRKLWFPSTRPQDVNNRYVIGSGVGGQSRFVRSALRRRASSSGLYPDGKFKPCVGLCRNPYVGLGGLRRKPGGPPAPNPNYHYACGNSGCTAVAVGTPFAKPTMAECRRVCYGSIQEGGGISPTKTQMPGFCGCDDDGCPPASDESYFCVVCPPGTTYEGPTCLDSGPGSPGCGLQKHPRLVDASGNCDKCNPDNDCVPCDSGQACLGAACSGCSDSGSPSTDCCLINNDQPPATPPSCKPDTSCSTSSAKLKSQSQEPTTCGIGQYAAAGSGACATCPAGQATVLKGQSQCEYCFCEPGKKCSSDGSCFDCEAGTYSPGTELQRSGVCLPCAEGTWQPKTGQTKCEPCDPQCIAGQSCNPVNGLCQRDGPCPAGQYGTDTDNCKPCKPGTYSTGRAVSCTKCDEGYYSSEGAEQCTPCDCLPGNSCPEGLSGSKRDCEACPAGSYGVGYAEPCGLCQEGSWSGTAGSSGCAACECSSGTSCKSGSTGPQACSPCDDGSYGPGGGHACAKCAAGTWSVGGAPCKPCDCDKGKACPAGSTGPSCQACPDGSYGAGGASPCEPCPKGSYCTGGLATPCAAGSYQDKTGQTSCKLCIAGEYAEYKGSVLCTECPAGTYNDGAGLPACIKTQAGTYSRPGCGSLDCCTPCPRNFICPDGGCAMTCIECPPGQYQDQLGQTSCKTCTNQESVCEEPKDPEWPNYPYRPQIRKEDSQGHARLEPIPYAEECVPGGPCAIEGQVCPGGGTNSDGNPRVCEKLVLDHVHPFYVWQLMCPPGMYGGQVAKSVVGAGCGRQCCAPQKNRVTVGGVRSAAGTVVPFDYNPYTYPPDLFPTLSHPDPSAQSSSPVIPTAPWGCTGTVACPSGSNRDVDLTDLSNNRCMFTGWFHSSNDCKPECQTRSPPLPNKSCCRDRSDCYAPSCEGGIGGPGPPKCHDELDCRDVQGTVHGLPWPGTPHCPTCGDLGVHPGDYTCSPSTGPPRTGTLSNLAYSPINMSYWPSGGGGAAAELQALWPPDQAAFPDLTEVWTCKTDGDCSPDGSTWGIGSCSTGNNKGTCKCAKPYCGPKCSRTCFYPEVDNPPANQPAQCLWTPS